MCQPPHRLGVLDLDSTDEQAFTDALLGTIAFTSLFNASGNPAMSVPLAWSTDGLPIGVQFVAPFGDEASLFRLGARLEAAQPWINRPRPRLTQFDRMLIAQAQIEGLAIMTADARFHASDVPIVTA